MYIPILFTVRPDLDQSAGSTRQLPLPPPGLSPLATKRIKRKRRVETDERKDHETEDKKRTERKGYPPF
jgi:hypothetical protein